MKLLAQRWPVVNTGEPESNTHILLGHGAGAPMDSPFMEALARALALHGIYVVRFELDYMAERRSLGKKRPPPRLPTLVDEFGDFVNAYKRGANEHGHSSNIRLLAGGKSMGGRVITQYAQSNPGALTATLCFGYPFHPINKPQQLRVSHFESLQTPCLIVQGSRDPFGCADEVCDYPLGQVQVQWLEGGDHDFKGARGSTLSQQDRIAMAAQMASHFSSPLPPLVQVPSK